MAEERNLGLARAADSSDDADSTKAELQRRMEEARESITQTVTEIKDTVVNQYQQVRENISDTLDWREQYRRHTVPFTVGAFAVGAFVGYKVMGAFQGGEDYEDEDAFDRIEAGFDRGLGASRSYAAQPVLGQSAAASRPRTNASTDSAEVFGRGSAESEDVGPETRPSYTNSYQAAAAPQAQSLASYATPSAGAAEEPEEPKGPGLIERFKETKAYDKLQEELASLGERALEELSRTARTVVVPALLGKLKNMIGIDLSGQSGGAQGGGAGQQASPSTSVGGQGGVSAGGSQQGGGTADAAGTTSRAATGGAGGYGAS